MTPVTGRRLLLAVALWALFTALAVGGSLVAVRLLAAGWARGHRPDLAAAAVAEAYLTLLAALLVAFGGLSGLRDRLAFRYTSGADIALALAVWTLTLFGGTLLTRALSPLIGQPQSNTVALLRQSFDPTFVAIIVPTVCLLAPACEELLFRGALFGWLRRRLPASLAILVTAGVFAGAHLLPALLPVLFVFGLGATWVRARTGSTLNSFAMHATQNTLAVAVTYAILSHGGPGGLT